VAAALALAWPLILVLLRVETWVAVMVVGLAVGVLLAGRRLVQRRADLAPGADGRRSWGSAPVMRLPSRITFHKLVGVWI
jgi:hypothetical protein